MNFFREAKGEMPLSMPVFVNMVQVDPPVVYLEFLVVHRDFHKPLLKHSLTY